MLEQRVKPLYYSVGCAQRTGPGLWERITGCCPEGDVWGWGVGGGQLEGASIVLTPTPSLSSAKSLHDSLRFCLEEADRFI